MTINGGKDGVQMPRWLWSVIGLFAAALVAHSVQMAVQQSTLNSLDRAVSRLEAKADSAVTTFADVKVIRAEDASKIARLIADIEKHERRLDELERRRRGGER